MLKMCGEHAEIIYLTLVLMAAAVVVLALFQVNLGPGKTDANKIISPWNFSQAPPQSLNRSEVKIIPDNTSSRPPTIGKHQSHTKARTSEGIRTASTIGGVR